MTASILNKASNEPPASATSPVAAKQQLPAVNSMDEVISPIDSEQATILRRQKAAKSAAAAEKRQQELKKTPAPTSVPENEENINQEKNLNSTTAEEEATALRSQDVTEIITSNLDHYLNDKPVQEPILEMQKNIITTSNQNNEEITTKNDSFKISKQKTAPATPNTGVEEINIINGGSKTTEENINEEKDLNSTLSPAPAAIMEATTSQGVVSTKSQLAKQIPNEEKAVLTSPLANSVVTHPLTLEQLEVKENAGNGDCLFLSFLNCLVPDAEISQALSDYARIQIVQFEKENMESLKLNFNEMNKVLTEEFPGVNGERDFKAYRAYVVDLLLRSNEKNASWLNGLNNNQITKIINYFFNEDQKLSRDEQEFVENGLRNEAYFSRMKTPTVFAGYNELLAISKKWGLNIYLKQTSLIDNLINDEIAIFKIQNAAFFADPQNEEATIIDSIADIFVLIDKYPQLKVSDENYLMELQYEKSIGLIERTGALSLLIRGSDNPERSIYLQFNSSMQHYNTLRPKDGRVNKDFFNIFFQLASAVTPARVPELLTSSSKLSPVKSTNKINEDKKFGTPAGFVPVDKNIPEFNYHPVPKNSTKTKLSNEDKEFGTPAGFVPVDKNIPEFNYHPVPKNSTKTKLSTEDKEFITPDGFVPVDKNIPEFNYYPVPKNSTKTKLSKVITKLWSLFSSTKENTKKNHQVVRTSVPVGSSDSVASVKKMPQVSNKNNVRVAKNIIDTGLGPKIKLLLTKEMIDPTINDEIIDAVVNIFVQEYGVKFAKMPLPKQGKLLAQIMFELNNQKTLLQNPNLSYPELAQLKTFLLTTVNKCPHANKNIVKDGLVPVTNNNDKTLVASDDAEFDKVKKLADAFANEKQSRALPSPSSHL